MDIVNTKHGPSSVVQQGDFRIHRRFQSGSSNVHVLFVTVRDYGMIKKISYNAIAQVSLKIHLTPVLHHFYIFIWYEFCINYVLFLLFFRNLVS